MDKIKTYVKQKWEAFKGLLGENLAMTMFFAALLGVMLGVHLVATFTDREKVELAPVEQTVVPSGQNWNPIPAPAVAPVKIRITEQAPKKPAIVEGAGQTVEQPARVIEVEVTPTPEPEFVRPAAIPQELRLTPENIRKLQGVGNTGFDEDFDIDEKEAKK